MAWCRRCWLGCLEVRASTRSTASHSSAVCRRCDASSSAVAADSAAPFGNASPETNVQPLNQVLVGLYLEVQTLACYSQCTDTSCPQKIMFGTWEAVITIELSL